MRLFQESKHGYFCVYFSALFGQNLRKRWRDRVSKEHLSLVWLITCVFLLFRMAD